MSITYTIPQSAILAHEKFVADFIAQLGKRCTLYFPYTETTCPNCVGGFQYVNGGPIPFTMGSPCPYCGGNNIIRNESTMSVTLLIYDDPRDFIKYGEFNVNIPDGTIQTRGLMSDLTNIQRCNRMTRDSINGIETLSYIRLGEAIPFGFLQRMEFLQFWRRGSNL